ncbi:hypothetical protein JMUB7522_27360 [Staphylococcus aureus]
MYKRQYYWRFFIVQELFEARNPKGKAILSEVSGRIVFSDKKKKGCLLYTSDAADEL